MYDEMKFYPNILPTFYISLNFSHHSNVRIFTEKRKAKCCRLILLLKDNETLLGLKCIFVLSVATCHWNVIPLNLSS